MINIEYDENGNDHMVDDNELTKREQIAASALQGLLANPGTVVQTDGSMESDLIARLAVECADALIAELEKVATE